MGYSIGYSILYNIHNSVRSLRILLNDIRKGILNSKRYTPPVVVFKTLDESPLYYTQL